MRLILFSFFIIILCSCGSNDPTTGADTKSNKSQNASISIEIEGASPGQASLIATYGDQNFKIDTASVNANGQLAFQRNEPYPSGLLYVMMPDKSYFQILMNEDQKFSLKTHASDLISAMEVDGSLENDLFYQTQKFENGLQPRFDNVAQRLQSLSSNSPKYLAVKKEEKDLVQQRKNYLQSHFKKHPNTLFTKFKKAGQNPDLREVLLSDGTIDTEAQVYHFRTEFWDNVDFSDDRLLHTPVIFNKLNRYITQLTVQQPDSIKNATRFLIDKVLDHPEYYKFFTNWVALKYEPTKTTLMDSEAIYVFMIQNYFTYERAYWSDSTQVYALQLRAHEMAQSLVGQKGPDVSSNDPKGITKSIYEIQSPYIIVFMYNPTCEHCIEEAPKLVQFYKSQSPKEIEVFAIALDTEVDAWKQFIISNGMDWINVHDPSNRSIYAKYYVDNTPEIYVLNPERTIIGKNLKVHQILEVVRQDKEKNR